MGREEGDESTQAHSLPHSLTLYHSTTPRHAGRRESQRVQSRVSARKWQALKCPPRDGGSKERSVESEEREESAQAMPNEPTDARECANERRGEERCQPPLRPVRFQREKEGQRNTYKHYKKTGAKK